MATPPEIYKALNPKTGINSIADFIVGLRSIDSSLFDNVIS
ncbi:hypothetical protein WG947_16560 [Pontibacter sp. H259]